VWETTLGTSSFVPDFSAAVFAGPIFQDHGSQSCDIFPPVSSGRTPIRWPSAWKDPSSLGLLKGTAIDCLVVDPHPDLEPLTTRARHEGLQVVSLKSLPKDVTLVKGIWPGIRLTQSDGQDRMSAGPTGAPWVDSNGWRVNLAAAMHPGMEVWVDAPPKNPNLTSASYVMAVADIATYGGRWIITLEDQLAAGISAQKPASLEAWKKIAAAAGFFPAHKEWLSFQAEAVIGIVSDFTGQNQYVSHELLNLVARTNQPYRVMVRSKVSAPSFAGLRAVLYADAESPAPELRQQILAFVQEGGMLITGPTWGDLPGTPVEGYEYEGYTERVFGKGKLAVSKADLTDPYLVANDSMVLVSHRYDLLRFWNGGAIGSYYTVAANRDHAAVQILFYARARSFGNASVRVVGAYREAKLWTLDQPMAHSIAMELQKDAVELHLPPISQYAAVELSA
jgi:hypothetical protein